MPEHVIHPKALDGIFQSRMAAICKEAGLLIQLWRSHIQTLWYSRALHERNTSNRDIERYTISTFRRCRETESPDRG